MPLARPALRLPSALAAALLLVACGGGTSGGPAPTFPVSGHLTGLRAGTLVLTLGGGNQVSLAADGPFTFPSELADGAAFAVSVAQDPYGQACQVADGSGTAHAAVTGVSVSCAQRSVTGSATVATALQLDWSLDAAARTITFTMAVETDGWVGLAFVAPGGTVHTSDMVVGWVDAEGTAHAADYRSTGYAVPVLDVQQDLTAVTGAQAAGRTSITFTRAFDTGDVSDLAFDTLQPLSIAWSRGSADPASSSTFPAHFTGDYGQAAVPLY